MSRKASPQQPGLDRDPLWYRTAVFYEVIVRSFFDSNGDGSGDIPGLIAKLDYLQWLGIDALWIPPFYESPLRDGGYDVSDFTTVLPEFGTLDDFSQLVEAAHERNMRIVIDYPLNHTSDQHAWFQQSRSDRDGPFGDYYVWNDTNDKYPNIRVIFVDTETSNWAFDEARGQYYFHRFFSHQPDLNFENPAVRAATLDVVRYWMRLGVDGIRLDAIPYLFESDGGTGESEPRTHDFVAEIRATVDAEFPGRMLIAEANQWPDDVLRFFGSDERPECHMAFNFPVMPQIFYSLRSQDAQELSRVLAQTTTLPAGAAWGVFLRNHDELTLEMVSEESRAQMYGWYAGDPRMRSNVGVRRRLAPLLENSRVELELAHALLFSLHGSPFLYYGDELGMGDNIWLNDRDSSRTPMQWSPDRNAGFSVADPGKLFLPVVQSLVFDYHAVNVESQRAQAGSLLHWVRNTLAVRRQHPVFGQGSLRVLEADDASVLAFVRESEGAAFASDTQAENILCVFNFSHCPVAVTVNATGYAGDQVWDVFGGARFPDVGEEGAVLLTMAAQSSYWLRIGSANA